MLLLSSLLFRSWLVRQFFDTHIDHTHLMGGADKCLLNFRMLSLVCWASSRAGSRMRALGEPGLLGRAVLESGAVCECVCVCVCVCVCMCTHVCVCVLRGSITACRLLISYCQDTLSETQSDGPQA